MKASRQTRFHFRRLRRSINGQRGSAFTTWKDLARHIWQAASEEKQDCGACNRDSRGARKEETKERIRGFRVSLSNARIDGSKITGARSALRTWRAWRSLGVRTSRTIGLSHRRSKFQFANRSEHAGYDRQC